MIYWTEEKQLQIESLLFIYAEASYFRLHDKNVFFFLYIYMFFFTRLPIIYRVYPFSSQTTQLVLSFWRYGQIENRAYNGQRKSIKEAICVHSHPQTNILREKQKLKTQEK